VWMQIPFFNGMKARPSPRGRRGHLVLTKKLFFLNSSAVCVANHHTRKSRRRETSLEDAKGISENFRESSYHPPCVLKKEEFGLPLSHLNVSPNLLFPNTMSYLIKHYLC
jgi:hypothetical protein